MPEKGLEDTLYVGLDDSNHAGKRKGEIAVATFSFDPEDAVIKNFGKRAHKGEADEWLRLLGREYKFTLLAGRKFKHQHNNLPFATKILVKRFLSDFDCDINGLELFINGELSRYQIPKFKKNSLMTFMNLM